MPVNLIQYRGAIGVFNCKKCVCANSSNLFSDKLFPKLSFQSLLGLLLTNSIFLSLLLFCLTMKNVKAKIKKIQILSSRAVHSVAVILFIHHIWLHGLMIKTSDDIELNSGPKHKQDQSLSICHWNLNSIPAHSFQKLELLQGYISSNKVDILCLSETFLNSDISCDDNNLQLPGFDLIRIDHASNTKRGGACIYYGNCLPLKLINICYLNKCITFVTKLGDKTCNFVSLYRSPNQSEDDFENFCNNFELTLDAVSVTNPFLIVAIGDFNAKSSNWYTGDTITFEGSKTETIASQFGLQQIMNEPTHIQGKYESCIDLIFSSQPYLVMSSGIHSPLHQNSHHQIIFAKFSLKVHYPPPYEREVWNFIKANTDHIKRAINGFPWERSFANLDINDKVYLFNKTIRNILSNFIPHETITFDDRDPPWVNSQVKHLINAKNAIYKNYPKNNKSNQSFATFQSFQSQLSSLITNLKNKYYPKVAKKLLDPSTSPKTHWSILKTFLNNKKIPVIPSISDDNKFITDFKQKAEIFNSHFSKQCTPLINNSKILSACHENQMNPYLPLLLK